MPVILALLGSIITLLILINRLKENGIDIYPKSFKMQVSEFKQDVRARRNLKLMVIPLVKVATQH